MLAVVKIAGQQFKVKAGDSLYVPHLEGNTGDSVEFSDVLFTSNGDAIVSGTDVKAVVKAEIISDLIKGDKVIIFKKKRRKGYQKWNNHRQCLTQILIQGILGKGESLKEELKSEKAVRNFLPPSLRNKVEKVEVVAEKKAPAKKAAAKKAPAKKAAKSED